MNKYIKFSFWFILLITFWYYNFVILTLIAGFCALLTIIVNEL